MRHASLARKGSGVSFAAMSALPQLHDLPPFELAGGTSSRPSALSQLGRLTELFASTAADHDRSGSFPRGNFLALHEEGLIALVAPRAFGGGGATLAEARQVIAAVAKGEPATALILSMTYLQHHAIARGDSRWPVALQERVARDAVREGSLINALRVEPELGSPARGGLPGTIARRDGDGWRISGHKLFTTGIEGLAWLVVWGRTDEPEPRIGNFLVPRDAPGIGVIANWDHLGLRASGSHEVTFDDVPIPLACAVDLRAPADWAPGAGSQTDIDAQADQQAWQAVLLGSLYDAVARAARDWLVGFLNARTPSNLGAPLASLPRVQEGVGEIEALLHANRVLLDDAARRADEGRPGPAVDSGLLKLTVTSQAIRAVELALPLTGNHGLSRQNPLERHYRDVLCGRVHTPQDDTVRIAAGRRALADAVR